MKNKGCAQMIFKIIKLEVSEICIQDNLIATYSKIELLFCLSKCLTELNCFFAVHDIFRNCRLYKKKALVYLVPSQTSKLYFKYDKKRFHSFFK